MNYRLVIPSRERAAWLMNQKHATLAQIEHLDPIFMVRNDDSQLEAYKRYCSRLTIYDGRNIYGAAQTYDMIIDQAITDRVDHLVILDDDLSLAMHNPVLGARPVFRLTSSLEATVLMQHFADIVCPEVPMASLTPIMSRSQPGVVSYCHPMMMAYSIYVPHFRDHPEHRFWVGKEIEARCDLNLTLRLLTSGYLTAFMATCFIPDNVNNPGGCSTYRDIECERNSVAFLKRNYPQFIRTHLKRGWVGDDSVIREAPVISWKKAFNSAQFHANFNEDASVFMYEHLTAYQTKYGEWIDELRRNS